MLRIGVYEKNILCLVKISEISGIINIHIFLEKPLINKKLLLELFPGKGGWTYTRIPTIVKKNKNNFGWVKVKGTIDGYGIKKYSLMPVKGGGLFLPVKAEIRKHIKKQAGDYVQVILYPDNEPLEIPEEMIACIKEEPEAMYFFNKLSEGEKKFYVQWIYSAKKEETKINRLAQTINKLLKRQKLYDKD